MADTTNTTAAATPEAQTSRRNEKVGLVVSTKMQKTIVVQVSRRVPHPLYKRIVTKHKKFYAHDEEGTARMGDIDFQAASLDGFGVNWPVKYE